MNFLKAVQSGLFAGRYPLSLFFTVFATLVYTPILIIYNGGDAQSLFTFFSFLPALGLCLAFLAFSIILKRFFPKVSFLMENIFAGLALYLLITILFFPVQRGVLDGGAPSFSKFDKISHLILFGLCLAATLIGLYKTKLGLFLRKIVALLGCFSIISGAYMGVNALPLSNSDALSQVHWENIAKLSTQSNIIVIGLDMVQREFAQDYFENSPEAQKLFDGFTFFTNTASAGIITVISLSTIVRGHVFEGKVNDAPPDDNLLNDLNNYGYEISASPIVRARIRGGGPGTEIPEIPIKNLEEQAIAAAFLGINRYIPFRIKASLAPEKEFGAASKLDHRNSFKRLISLLHIDNTCEKKVIWLHSLQTHLPVKFTREGTYSQNLNDDDVYGEVDDGLNMVGDLIEKLKSLGVYDNTMILVISDHGFGPLTNMKTLTPERRSYLLSPVSKSMWGKSGRKHAHVVGRYEPMIMIKPFAAHGALGYSVGAVSLPDIRKTMNEALSPGSGAKLEGVNILDYKTLPRERTIPAFIFNKDVFNPSDFFSADNWKIGSIRLPIPENYKQLNDKDAETEK